MQSNAAKALVAVGSIAAIVVLFVVFSGSDDEGEATTEAVATATETTEPTDPADSGEGAAKPEKPQKPPEPEFETIVVRGGQPKGGVADLDYGKGDRVRLEVRSDVAEHVHVHGYDIFEEVPAGGTAKLSFAAEIDGVFEVELEDSAVQIAQLTVRP